MDSSFSFFFLKKENKPKRLVVKITGVDFACCVVSRHCLSASMRCVNEQNGPNLSSLRLGLNLKRWLCGFFDGKNILYSAHSLV